MAARIAYSVTCPHLRTTSCTDATVAVETFGANQRRNGPMKREVCSAESRSVDPMKMKIIHPIAGSQNFRNPRTENETTRAVLVLISRRGKSETRPTPG